jgi:hypothetical protein
MKQLMESIENIAAEGAQTHLPARSRPSISSFCRNAAAEPPADFGCVSNRADHIFVQRLAAHSGMATMAGVM